MAAEGQRSPDWVEVNKGRGRIEGRALWLVPSQALDASLAAEYEWPAVR